MILLLKRLKKITYRKYLDFDKFLVRHESANRNKNITLADESSVSKAMTRRVEYRVLSRSLVTGQTKRRQGDDRP